MANPEHLAKLKKGVEAWNAWRKKNPFVRPDPTESLINGVKFLHPDFEGANFYHADLRGADFKGAILRRTDLRRAKLSHADLSHADLRGADLRGAILRGVDLASAKLVGANLGSANLSRADLMGADLNDADLRDADLGSAHLGLAKLNGADLNDAGLPNADLTCAELKHAELVGANLTSAKLASCDLIGTDLTGAHISHTLFLNVGLAGTKGLGNCKHGGPSSIDHQTLERSGRLPEVFLRGCGLSNNFIEYLPAIFGGNPIQFYSCFISFASKDEEFAKRLHADLQDNGVRCWFAPEDMKIGNELRPTLDEAIRVRDKLLVVLSYQSLSRPWVKREVEQAFDEEGRRGEPMLFPIRLDDSVLEAKDGWATDLRRRHIGDFTNWKDHDAYKKAFDRLLRDLKVEQSE